MKLLLFIFGHIRKWEIDKISLINAIKWGASILVNEISVYKGRLLDTHKPIAQSTEERRASVSPEFVIFGEGKNLITVREGKLRL